MVRPLEALFFLPSSSENDGDNGGGVGPILTGGGEEWETGRKIAFMRVVRVCVGQVFNGPSPKNSAKQITNEILYCKKMFVTIKMIPF